jgi:hypothetical protein
MQVNEKMLNQESNTEIELVLSLWDLWVYGPPKL